MNQSSRSIPMTYAPIPPFEKRLRQEGVQLRRSAIETVQINVGKLCNQSCSHCHVEAGPGRSEIMNRRQAELALEFVVASGAGKIDLTGGAPELNPSFRFLVAQSRCLGCQVILRSNLSVLCQPDLADLPEFLAENLVEITASLPCYTEDNVDRQRGKGAFQKSIRALRRLNGLGYGQGNSGLTLNLVYNPLDARLPGCQQTLEADYRRELSSRFGLVFNYLFTITNMPIGRFGGQLVQHGSSGEYSQLLAGAFNVETLQNLMCLRMISLSWDGYLFDCDFNQMLELRLGNPYPVRLDGTPSAEILQQLEGQCVRTGLHCYGCTAGAGSSCIGSLVS